MVSRNCDVNIHEFSREFIDVSCKDGRWVSGGFGKEVGAFDVDVPDKIRQAVNKGDFRINDNYPPLDRDYALIAREIDEYSVLAVATREMDDKGNRPLVAYRYFWLKKLRSDIDGVGTLLLWWLDEKKPQFEFKESKSSSRINYSAKFCNREYFEPYVEEVESYLSEIKHYPYALKTNLPKEFPRRGLHALALHLQKQYNTPLAWAWNVSWLEKSARFTLIYCADNQAYDKTLHDIGNNIHQLSVALTPTPSKPQQSEESSLPLGYSHKQSQITQPALPTSSNMGQSHRNTNSIKKCLLTIARNDGRPDKATLLELAKYLEQVPINQWQWEEIIDQTTMNNLPNPSVARYWALLTILGYTSIRDWLLWLRNAHNSSFETAALKTQKIILEFCFKYENQQVYEQLKYVIFKGISNLLLNFKSLNSSYIKYQYIQEVLVKQKPENIWYPEFKEYARSLVSQLNRREKDHAEDNFYREVLDDLQKWETSDKQNSVYKEQYSTLANLMSQLKNYSLSAFFYQLSKGTVPLDIYEQVDVEIIPLTQPDDSNLKNRDKTSPFFLLGTSVSLLLTFSILAGLFLQKNGILPPIGQLLGNNPSQNDKIDLQHNISLWENGEEKEKQQLKPHIIEEMKKIRNYLNENYLNGLDNKPDNYDQDYSFLKTEFTPTPSLKSKDLAKKPIQQDSSPEDIKTVQEILLSSFRFNQIKTNGIFDEVTVEAVQNIQGSHDLKYDLKNMGKVDDVTWKFLLQRFVNTQVNMAAEFLQKSFQIRTNNKQIKQDIQDLRKCKKRCILGYISCVQKLTNAIEKK